MFYSDHIFSLPVQKYEELLLSRLYWLWHHTLTLRAPSKMAADDTFIFFLLLSFFLFCLAEDSMKYQVLFSVKKQ